MAKKETTISLEVVREYGTAEGTWQRPPFEPTERWDVNYSGILSKLIRVAGKTCTAYSSDLFRDWMRVEEVLRDPNYQGGLFLFGFRETGVDNTNAVTHRMGCPECYGQNPYKSVWAIDIQVDGACMRMTLAECERFAICGDGLLLVADMGQKEDPLLERIGELAEAYLSNRELETGELQELQDALLLFTKYCRKAA